MRVELVLLRLTGCTGVWVGCTCASLALGSTGFFTGSTLEVTRLLSADRLLLIVSLLFETLTLVFARFRLVLLLLVFRLLLEPFLLIIREATLVAIRLVDLSLVRVFLTG